MRILRCSKDEIYLIISDNNKQRFALGKGEKTGKEYIRANQGHSVHVTVEMKEITDAGRTCMHGTNMTAWKIIEKEGLSRMKRQHIHMAGGMPGEVISGMRNTAKVVIMIDLQKCFDKNIKFYESLNGVILSPGNEEGIIPPSCFGKVSFL